MSEPRIIPRELLFGSIELKEAPPRREGNRLYSRYRSIHRDEHGNVTKDETCETGAAIILPEERWARNDCLSDIIGIAPEMVEFVEAETWRDRWARRLAWLICCGRAHKHNPAASRLLAFHKEQQ